MHTSLWKDKLSNTKTQKFEQKCALSTCPGGSPLWCTGKHQKHNGIRREKIDLPHLKLKLLVKLEKYNCCGNSFVAALGLNIRRHEKKLMQK